jgi:hypothetical protein
MAAEDYGTAHARARAIVAAARLADPDEHFPYRHHVVAGLLDQGAAMPADDGDPADDRTVADYMSREIADASRDMIAAQERYLKDPGDATMAAYDIARTALEEARMAHRADRPGTIVRGIQGP